MARWEQVLLVLVLLAVAFTHSAPVEDGDKDTRAIAVSTKVTDSLDSEKGEPVKTTNTEDESTSQETKEGAISVEKPEEIEGSGALTEEQEEVATPNKEVVDYKDIEVDDGSDVVNDNNEVSYAGLFDDNFEDYHMTEQDAKELLRELDDPAQVALFIMESDDVTGFLRAVGMLLEQGFISEEYAFIIKEMVSQELEELLMLQDQELFGNPLGLQPANSVDTDYIEELLNQPVPYNPQDYFDYPVPYEETYPVSVDYEMFQKPYSDETVALSEIANIVADQIETGEMSTERGERIIDILSQLLPESFWQEDNISDEMMQEMGQDFSNLYPSLPVADGYRTYEDEKDEPIPGGDVQVNEEVVVDEEGRPVAEMINTEEKQQTGGEPEGADAEEIEEELEKELQDIEPQTEDEVEQALRDVDKFATGDEADDNLEDEMVDAANDNSAWKDLVLLLEEGKVSDELLKELGIFNKDLESTEDLDNNDKDNKP